MSFNNSRPGSPVDFEKISTCSHNGGRSPSQRPSLTPSESDWYLKKRSDRRRSSTTSTHTSESTSSSSNTLETNATRSSKEDRLTPLPPSMEVSLAILTSGLSVAAFHAVKSISDRRASKKLRAAQSQQVTLTRQESLLIPSSTPEQISGPRELEAEPVAELDSMPLELPPAYSPRSSTSALCERH